MTWSSTGQPSWWVIAGSFLVQESTPKKASVTRLFNRAAGMALPSARCDRFGQAHTGDGQTRRYTTTKPPPFGGGGSACLRNRARLVTLGFPQAMKYKFFLGLHGYDG
jgi:hypothetical protein